MPTSDAYSKNERLLQLQLLFWRNQGKQYRTKELADLLEVSVDTVTRYLTELSADGRLPLIQEGWYWHLPQDARFDLLPIKLSLPEAASLYLAGRLLVMTQNRRNQHVLSALTKLVAAMPETIAPHQHTLVDMLVERQQGQENVSDIFEALTLGWATRRKLRLHYSPPNKKSFECSFSPYLLEPSGIGRTIYAIGRNSTTKTNDFRTYKLERIDFAELTNEPFEIEPDFDGPTRLKHAWGVMYGDEACVEVELRFKHGVIAKRLKETIWHPSQQIEDTPQGRIWKAQISETLEIENWIRGWGANCEVLAPLSLRQTMIQEVQHLIGLYQLQTAATPTTPTTPATLSPDEPDTNFLSRLWE